MQFLYITHKSPDSYYLGLISVLWQKQRKTVSYDVKFDVYTSIIKRRPSLQRTCKWEGTAKHDADLWELPAGTGSLDHIVSAALPVPPVCSAHRLSPHPASVRPEPGTQLTELAGSPLKITQVLIHCISLCSSMRIYILHISVLNKIDNFFHSWREK